FMVQPARSVTRETRVSGMVWASSRMLVRSARHSSARWPAARSSCPSPMRVRSLPRGRPRKPGAVRLRGGDPLAFRTIAYNVLQCTGYPEGAPDDHVSPEAFAEALGAYAPDVVTLAECPDRETVLEIAARLRM